MNDTLSMMAECKYEQEAKSFCEAVRILASHEDRLENLEAYLSRFFKAWLEKFASTPEGLADDMLFFANME